MPTYPEFYDAMHSNIIKHRGRKYVKVTELTNQEKYQATFQDAQEENVQLHINATKQTGKGLGQAGTKWNVQGKVVRTR